MKSNDTGLGKHIYNEWLILVVDYYCILRKSEAVYEIVIPAVSSVICSLCYFNIEKVYIALKYLSNILPTAISILIGFTAMLITLLLTGDNENIKNLKTKEAKKKLHGKEISLYQGLHILFSHILVSEIVLLIWIFIYLFCSGFEIKIVYAVIFLVVEIYLILNILLSVLRGITSLYFSFFHS